VTGGYRRAGQRRSLPTLGLGRWLPRRGGLRTDCPVLFSLALPDLAGCAAGGRSLPPRPWQHPPAADVSVARGSMTGRLVVFRGSPRMGLSWPWRVSRDITRRRGRLRVVTHGRATRAMSVSEARVNASGFRKCRAMVSPRMLLTISAARRPASSPPMARLRLATRSFRNALIEAAASGAVSMDRTRALVSGGRAPSRTSRTSCRWAAISVRSGVPQLDGDGEEGGLRSVVLHDLWGF
jgi:hypothetical protein